MDFKYIDAQISKAVRGPGRVMYGEIEKGIVGISVDGFVLYAIPEKDFIFDTKKFERPPTDVKAFLPKGSTETAEFTDELVTIKNGIATKLKSENIETYINTKLLKGFGKDPITFKVSSVFGSILIYQNDNLSGLVLPVRVHKKGD